MTRAKIRSACSLVSIAAACGILSAPSPAAAIPVSSSLSETNGAVSRQAYEWGQWTMYPASFLNRAAAVAAVAGAMAQLRATMGPDWVTETEIVSAFEWIGGVWTQVWRFRWRHAIQ